MTTGWTEHKFYLHVCNECGRTEVYRNDASGKHCKKSISRPQEEKEEFVEKYDEFDSVDEVSDYKECRGKWVTSRMYPEEDIFDVHTEADKE